MNLKYGYQQDDDGYNVGCDCCGHEAPVCDFPKEPRGGKRWLCEFCASSFVANMDQYPEQYDRSVAMLGKSLSIMMNILMDQITGRKPPQETE